MCRFDQTVVCPTHFTSDTYLYARMWLRQCFIVSHMSVFYLAPVIQILPAQIFASIIFMLVVSHTECTWRKQSAHTLGDDRGRYFKTKLVCKFCRVCNGY